MTTSVTGNLDGGVTALEETGRVLFSRPGDGYWVELSVTGVSGFGEYAVLNPEGIAWIAGFSVDYDCVMAYGVRRGMSKNLGGNCTENSFNALLFDRRWKRAIDFVKLEGPRTVRFVCKEIAREGLLPFALSHRWPVDSPLAAIASFAVAHELISGVLEMCAVTDQLELSNLTCFERLARRLQHVWQVVLLCVLPCRSLLRSERPPALT